MISTKTVKIKLLQSIFPTFLLLLVISIFLPFFTEAPVSWFTGFCYIIYDSILLLYVAIKVSSHLKNTFVTNNIVPKSSLCLLISAKNEKIILGRCLDRIYSQTQKPDQIIIIDDGSTDGSFQYLQNMLNLKSNGTIWQSVVYENTFVLQKENSGKARSLNLALNYVKTDLVMTLDADTFMDPYAVAEVINEFASNSSLQVVGGVLEPTCKTSWNGSLFKTFQKFEYIRSFLSRQAWVSSNCLLLVSGAFAAYKTKTLKLCGGFDPDSFVEDYELTHRIYKYCFENKIPVHVGIAAKAVAITDCPDAIGKFLKQRQRWFGGFLQTIYKYREMVGAVKYANVGKIMLPIKSIDTLQPLYGLVSLYALAAIFFLDKKLHPIIVTALIFKIILDYVFHFYGLYLYNQWQGRKVPKLYWIQSALVTLCEPLFFQPLRHIGALLGWVSFLRNKNEWTAQRDVELYQVLDDQKVA